ncbi:MAG: acetolactate synthase [Deltaproteobacteria bacterium RIFCSPLOWO2_02_FULL_53_8]|nr:MAG: acetolactate synthase [Deltaproteobacteria bacterium RIFCSPLOWO2_02_FULL_53_8]
MTAADLFVESLEREGVEYIFGLPGEESLDLLDAIRRSKIRLIVTRHEQAAAFMAATRGRLLGKAGVVLSTLGPGATNLVTGVAFAQLGGMPLVVITSQKPIKRSKQGQFQIINVVEMMKPITKSAHQIVSADLIPSIVREAFRKAEEERPGAVHLELPEDVAREKTVARPLEKIKGRRPSPDSKAVEIAVSMIESAVHPLMLIAAGANRKRIRGQLQAFINKTGIPFFTTQMGKGVMDERNPHHLGTAALMDNDFIHRAVEHADLIIAIGHDTAEKPPAVMGYGRRKVIHVNFYPAVIDDVYFPNLEVIGDIAHSVAAIEKRVTPRRQWDFSFFTRVKAELASQSVEKSHDDAFPIKPQRLVAELRAAVPHDGIVALDNGMYKLWLARNYPAYEQNTVLLDNAFATMGAGLSVGIAAKLTYPKRKVICVCGDGGFMMNSQELETAMRLKVDITVLIVNDGGYGMIKWKQDAMKLAPFGLDFTNPDFVKYAQSYGATGFRVEQAADLPVLLARCLGSKGVNLIDCPIDYSENIKVMTEELKERAGRL